MRRRDLLKKNGPVYVFSAATTSKTVTPAASSFTISVTSTKDGANISYSATYSGTMISSVTTAATSVTIKCKSNSGSSRSGTVTLTQSTTNKVITINLTQQADYVDRTSDSTSKSVTQSISNGNIIGYVESTRYNHCMIYFSSLTCRDITRTIVKTTSYYKSGRTTTATTSDTTTTGSPYTISDDLNIISYTSSTSTFKPTMMNLSVGGSSGQITIPTSNAKFEGSTEDDEYTLFDAIFASALTITVTATAEGYSGTIPETCMYASLDPSVYKTATISWTIGSNNGSNTNSFYKYHTGYETTCF